MRLSIKTARKLSGIVKVPGDKSISHRAVMLGAISQGITEIEGFLHAQDCLSTIRCVKDLGIEVELKGSLVVIEGRGLDGMQEPSGILDVGNSGTTIRLLAGILAGQAFTTFIQGDSSISSRPMARVTKPLQEMGAIILGRDGANQTPLAIRGGSLKPFAYRTPIASAQVKSALLLAGLYTPGWTEIQEPFQSRNHTELMLRAFGAKLECQGSISRIKGRPVLQGKKVVVPGDLSSAAFFLVAALIVPDSSIILENVGLNPTRDGVIEVLKAMGGRIRIYNQREVAGELMGSLEVETSELHGITIGGSLIPRLIDEIPVLAVAALFARGVTEIRDAAELKVKESNRINAIAQGLLRLGARIEELPDGLRIHGGVPLRGNTCDSCHDHRIAMSLAVAGLAAEGETIIENSQAVDISFPQFPSLLKGLREDHSYG